MPVALELSILLHHDLIEPLQLAQAQRHLNIGDPELKPSCRCKYHPGPRRWPLKALGLAHDAVAAQFRHALGQQRIVGSGQGRLRRW